MCSVVFDMTWTCTVNVVVCFRMHKRTVPGVVGRGKVFFVLLPPPSPQVNGGAWARAECGICLFLHEQGSFCRGTGLFVCVMECFCIVELVFQILCYIRLLR